MDTKPRIILICTLIVIPAMIPVLIFGDRGSKDLSAIEQEYLNLKVGNSIKGLELLDQIDVLKRLRAGDLKLIEHIARSELGLVLEDELIFVNETATEAHSRNDDTLGVEPAFRFLSEEEFEELLNFDPELFEFYEELSDFAKPAKPG